MPALNMDQKPFLWYPLMFSLLVSPCACDDPFYWFSLFISLTRNIGRFLTKNQSKMEEIIKDFILHAYYTQPVFSVIAHVTSLKNFILDKVDKDN